ncbi:unnamed protein product [Rotaria sp. Silwood1]|nr:unnamed protein product [Rotaria sp. Silwood1]CAF0835952.1 unnamed protein product [Rotaria sp. Silwood1]
MKNNEYNQIMDEIKSENNLTNIGNNPHALLIPKDECNQLHFQIPVNDIVNENDGSLKCVDDFIISVAAEIYELIRRQKKMDKFKEKELEKRQEQALINK